VARLKIAAIRGKMLFLVIDYVAVMAGMLFTARVVAGLHAVEPV